MTETLTKLTEILTKLMEIQISNRNTDKVDGNTVHRYLTETLTILMEMQLFVKNKLISQMPPKRILLLNVDFSNNIPFLATQVLQ